MAPSRERSELGTLQAKQHFTDVNDPIIDLREAWINRSRHKQVSTFLIDCYLSVSTETLSITARASQPRKYLIAHCFQFCHIPDVLTEQARKQRDDDKRHKACYRKNTKMAFLINRVTPEPVPPSADEAGTELSDSLGSMKEKSCLINNNEKDSSETTDHGGTNECQEGLDGLPETDVIKNGTNRLQNERRSCSPHSKRLDAWNLEENLSSRRSSACDRVLLLTMCLMSAAALMLTLLMMFGVVGPMQCSCSGKTGNVSYHVHSYYGYFFCNHYHNF